MVTYLCPATAITVNGKRFACLNPLPCETHGIDDQITGSALYGDIFILMPDDRIPDSPEIEGSSVQ